MSVEEKEYEINIPHREAVFCYVTENTSLSREDLDNIKRLLGEKYAMLEQFPLLKVSILWVTEKLTEDELKQLSEKYGFYEP